MRIVVVSPPRSGNHWVKCLLGAIYGLTEIGGEEKPDSNPRQFRAAVAAGAFPDGTIAHLHSRFNRRLLAELEALPAHVVTAVRDPYDAFVSYYHWAQSRQPGDPDKASRAAERPRARLVGRALDDPEVLAFLAEEYGTHLERAVGWLHSGRAIPVRYEDLHAAPAAALTRATDQIAPVDPQAIERAIAACQIDRYRQDHPGKAQTIRTGAVGGSRAELGEAHLVVMRERWGELIEALGYLVR